MCSYRFSMWESAAQLLLQQRAVWIRPGWAKDSECWQASMGKRQGQVGGDGCWSIGSQGGRPHVNHIDPVEGETQRLFKLIQYFFATFSDFAARNLPTSCCQTCTDCTFCCIFLLARDFKKPPRESLYFLWNSCGGGHRLQWWLSQLNQTAVDRGWEKWRKNQKLKAEFGFGSLIWPCLLSSFVPFFFFRESNVRNHKHIRHQMDVFILFAAFHLTIPSVSSLLLECEQDQRLQSLMSLSSKSKSFLSFSSHSIKHPRAHIYMQKHANMQSQRRWWHLHLPNLIRMSVSGCFKRKPSSYTCLFICFHCIVGYLNLDAAAAIQTLPRCVARGRIWACGRETLRQVIALRCAATVYLAGKLNK